jgi:hypothetical protein
MGVVNSLNALIWYASRVSMRGVWRLGLTVQQG